VPLQRIRSAADTTDRNRHYATPGSGMIPLVELDSLDSAVAAHEARWAAVGVAWEIICWPLTEKPAASLRAESPTATGELILWVSGEAEMTHAQLPVTSEPAAEHYDLTSELGLNGCLDDFERHLGV
jgi:hypothetical protein